MANKILRCILCVVIAVLATSFAVITGALYQHFGDAQEAQLKDELSLAASATEQLGENYLATLKSDRYRLTWIDSDGTVLFDTHAKAADMENHAEREEVREAVATGSGSSVRRSSMLTEQTVYEATRLEDGSVLRISVSRATAFVLMLDMLQPIVVILLAAIALSAWLARRMAKRVVEPLNNLDLDRPLENDAYEELSPLLNRIHAQHVEIERQMQELKQRQSEFEQITNNMSEALVLLGKADEILSINPAAKSLFNADDGCIGENLLTIDRKQSMRLALSESKMNGHSEFRESMNGREYQFSLSRIDSDGEAHGTVVLAFDITDQVHAERNRREFTANVSHELKTPLQSIIGSAELMESGIVKDEDAPRFVARIREEASRLVSLIDDIIRLSQLDEGSEMPCEEVSLRSLAEDVCKTLADAAEAKGVSLEVTGGDGVVSGVRGLLYEVVYNLCDNAVKYNRPGGSVKVLIDQKPSAVCLSVQDTGIGIPSAHQSKVFERFYRVDKSHSKQSGGTGLGLSIVKRAVQYHHGKISIESEPYKGTTISVLLETKTH